MGPPTLYVYDALDRMSQTTDPVGRISRQEYDATGQLLKVIRAYGTPLQQDYARYSYTANGQRASLRDANDNRSVYVYDPYDRLRRLYFPVATLGANAANTGGIAESALTCTSGGTSPDYEGYDDNGNRTSLRLRSGETIGFEYDVLDRPTVKDIPGGTAADVYTTYDLAGRMLSQRFVSAGGQGILYAWDAAGRLLTETSFGQALAYQYDTASNRTRLTWPDSQFVTWTFDAMNRVDLVRQSGTTLLADYDYHALGQRAKLTRGNGAVTDFGFDTAQRLTALVHDLPGSADDQSYGFGYTQASQVAMQSASNAAYTWSAPAVSGRTYARNGLNQYTSVGGISFTHDARGNLTQDGSRTLAYDLENRLLSVSGPASLSLGYDPAGRLRQSVAGSATTQFLYSGSALVAEYDGAGNVLRRYVHGPGVDEPLVWYEGATLADPRYLIADRQGSIIATRGASTVRHAYGPYGEPDAWAGSRFRYTGQIALPEAGLYHYKARVYDPALGRFLQTDPVGYADDVNLYVYTLNDPVDLIDVTGKAPNQAGATTWAVIQAELKVNPSLDALAANHIQNTNRYFYTDQYGWVDVRHFAAAASMTASGVPGWITESMGLANEAWQWATEWGQDYRSGFSPEDLPSNSAGVNFGRFFKGGSDPIEVAFAAWARGSGARDPTDPLSGFGRLPPTDPSANGGAGRGSSNFSSAPPGKRFGSAGTDTSGSSQGWSITGSLVIGTRGCGRILTEGC
jgi:RHS repeat-associated protein